MLNMSLNKLIIDSLRITDQTLKILYSFHRITYASLDNEIVFLAGLTNFYSEVMKGLGASSRLWELADRVPSIDNVVGVVPTDHIKGRICFQNVNFSFPSRPDISIFSSMSFLLLRFRCPNLLGCVSASTVQPME